MSNLLLVLGYLGCALAAYSHLNPVPFPENKPILLACVVGYMVLSGTMTLLLSYVQKDTIFKSKERHGRKLVVSTTLEKYDFAYKVRLELVRTGKSLTVDHRICESIASFFDEDGLLQKDRLCKVLDSSLKVIS